MRSALTAVHIVAGVLSLLFGYSALWVTKGARLHRSSGTGFVYAMLAMSLLGATIALGWNVAPMANAPVAFLTAYLVLTGLTAVRPSPSHSRALDLALMLIATTVCVVFFAFGAMALSSPTGKLHGMPSAPFLIFGFIALLASTGDLRMISRGGTRALRGAPRLARHLWRMCTALLIAAFSFFLGQAKVIPKPIRIFPLLAIPPLLVLVALVYWLWRVRVRRSLRGTIIGGQPERAPTRRLRIQTD